MSNASKSDKNKHLTRSNTASLSLTVDATLPKRSREDLRNSDDDVDSLTDLWTRMQTMFSGLNDRISQMEERMEANIAATKADLSNRINQLEEHVTTLRQQGSDDINALRGEINTLRNDLLLSNESMERLKKSHQLIFSGIPFTRNEDLRKIFELTASALGITPPIVELRRLAKSPIAIGSKPLILCEFALKHRRDAFYSAYLNHRSLTLQNVGFSGDERVFINENLTMHARGLRTEALKLKKSGHIVKVVSKDGIIFIQRNTNLRMEPIYDREQL